MKYFSARVLSAVLAGSLIVSTPVFAAKDINSLKKQKQAAQNKVEALQKELNETMTEIDELEDELVDVGEKKLQAEKDLEVAKKKEKKQYADMKIRIKYMYEEGDASAVEAIVNASDFSELLNKAEYVTKIHKYDREKLQEYLETKQEISDLNDDLEEKQETLEKKSKSFEEKEDKLNTLVSENKEKVSNLDDLIETAEKEAAEEAARKKAEEEARKKAEEEAAAQQAAQQAESESENNTTDESGSTDTDSTDTDSSDSSSSSSYVSGSVVSRAYSALGKPYVWGAVGPNSFDCSGLVGFCLTGRYARTCTSGDFAGLPTVSDPQPGDICVRSGHVGVYIGNGQMIHAPHTGDVVKIAAVPSNMRIVRP